MWWFGNFVEDFLAIWVIIDPITALPIFIALTAGCEGTVRRRIAGLATLVSLALLAFFICLGQIIINAIGVSLLAFQIAGGLILFLFAVDLVIGKEKRVAVKDLDKTSPLPLAIYPLAVPTLAGPGAMLTVMLRTDNSRISLLEQVHTGIAVALVLGITYLLLLSAGFITRVIGAGGANVIRRIMGMILAAYATTLVLHGLAGWLHLPPI